LLQTYQTYARSELEDGKKVARALRIAEGSEVSKVVKTARNCNPWLDAKALGEGVQCEYTLEFFSPLFKRWYTAPFFKPGELRRTLRTKGRYDRGAGLQPPSEYILFHRSVEGSKLLKIEYWLLSTVKTEALVLTGTMTTDELTSKLAFSVPIFPTSVPPVEGVQQFEERKRKLIVERYADFQATYALVLDPSSLELIREVYWVWNSKGGASDFDPAANSLMERLTQGLTNNTFPDAILEIEYIRGQGRRFPRTVIVRDGFRDLSGYLSFTVIEGCWFLDSAIFEAGKNDPVYPVLAMATRDAQLSRLGRHGK